MDFNKFCKQCRYYQFDLSDGIVCGLTKSKPSFQDVCVHFMKDPNRADSFIKKTDSDNSDDRDKLRKDLKKWGITLVILGIAHLLLTRFLDPVWGFLIIVLGVINLTSKSVGMLLVNGISLLFVGVMNIVSSVAEGFNPWSFFGIMQLVWGIQEIKKYNDYKKRLSKQTISKIILHEDNSSVEREHSKLGIASVVLAIVAFVFEIIFIINVTMGQVAEETGSETVPLKESITGLVLIFIPLLLLTGIGLGIAGLIEKQRKRVFPIIGLILCISQILILGILVLIGIVVGE